MRILIDTNVILDVWLAREPFLADSARLLTGVEQGKLTGILCPTTVTTLHYLVKKQKGEKKARALIGKLLSICEVGIFQKAEAQVALESEIKDFEDAVIESVAMKANAAIIATRNTVDFRKSRVPAKEPQEISW